MTIREQVLFLLGLDRLLAARPDDLVTLVFLKRSPAPTPEGAVTRFTVKPLGAVHVLPENAPGT